MASPEMQRSTPAEPDWTDQVTDLVVDLVDGVREKTTGPVLTAARGLVFGSVGLIVLFVLAIVGLILTGRAVALLPFAVWIAYLALGILFSAVGFWCWSRRFSK